MARVSEEPTSRSGEELIVASDVGDTDGGDGTDISSFESLGIGIQVVEEGMERRGESWSQTFSTAILVGNDRCAGQSM